MVALRPARHLFGLDRPADIPPARAANPGLSEDKLASLILDYADFCGDQPDGNGGSFQLWNLKKAIPGHPKNSTVTRSTLVAAITNLHG